MFRKVGFSLGFFLFAANVLATELQVASLDTTAGSGISSLSTISIITGVEGSGAWHVTLSSTQTEVNNSPYVWKYVVDSSAWQNYDGVKFWVKSDAGPEQTSWGIVELIYDSGNYFRFYAGFQITSSWTEVTIPWREFVQRNYKGTIDTVLPLANIQAIGFAIKPPHDKDNLWRGPKTFDVDNLRLVDGLSPSPTPVPSFPDLPKSRAKVLATQPLKILCLGDSLTYGVGLPAGTRAAEAYPAPLQTLLRSALYANITTVNHGIGGEEYWSFACNVQDFVAEEAPDLITVEFMFNDATSASNGNFTDTSNIANFRDNVDRALDIFLRYDQADVAVILPPPHVIGGKNTQLDPWAAQIEASAIARNLVVIDVYGRFMAKPEVELVALYDLPDPRPDDYTHINAAGHQEIADVVYNTILPYLQNGDGEAPDITLSKAVLYGTVSDASSLLIQMTVSGVSLGTLTGAWTSQEVTLNTLPTPTIIPVVGTDDSGNARTVNVTIGP